MIVSAISLSGVFWFVCLLGFFCVVFLFRLFLVYVCCVAVFLVTYLLSLCPDSVFLAMHFLKGCFQKSACLNSIQIKQHFKSSSDDVQNLPQHLLLLVFFCVGFSSGIEVNIQFSINSINQDIEYCSFQCTPIIVEISSCGFPCTLFL